MTHPSVSGWYNIFLFQYKYIIYIITNGSYDV